MVQKPSNNLLLGPNFEYLQNKLDLKWNKVKGYYWGNYHIQDIRYMTYTSN